MNTPKKITERFYQALEAAKEEYGRGFNKFICIETGFSSGFISQVVRQRQTPTPETQEKILKALKINYQDILADTHQRPILTDSQKEYTDMIETLSAYKELKEMLKKDNERLERENIELKGQVAELEAALLGEENEGRGRSG